MINNYNRTIKEFSKMKIYTIIGFLTMFGALANAQTVKIVSDEKTNSLIIKAPIAMQKQIEQLVRDLDRENNEMTELKVIQLVYLQASEISPAMQNVMNNYKPIPIKSSQIEINNNNWNNTLHGLVVADDRTNKLIIISDKTAVSNIEKIVKELDKKANISNSATITKLKNANSTTISEIINNISRR